MTKHRSTRRTAHVLALLGALSPAAAQAQPPGPLGPDVAAEQKAPANMFVYSVKFVCGEQRPQPGAPGEPPVKPGNYATEINIHNYQFAQTPVHKRVIFLVNKGEAVGREPKQAKPSGADFIALSPFNATMDDCNRIWQIANQGSVPPSPMPLMIGFLVLMSPRELAVDAVYTAEVPGSMYEKATGISIDVERVEGRRVFLHHGLQAVEPVPAAPID